VAENYDVRRSLTKNWQMEDSIIRDIASSLPQSSTILDAPVGTGRFIAMFVDLGFKVYGVDISDDMLAVAAKHDSAQGSAVTLTRGDLEALPLDANQVDASFCVRFLNWVPEPVMSSVIGELARVTKSTVVIHVRSRRAATMQELVGSVVPGITRMLKPAILMLTAKSVVKTLIRKKSSKAVSGYVLHSEAEVMAAIKSAGLVVEKHISISTKVSLSTRTAAAQFIYVLKLDAVSS